MEETINWLDSGIVCAARQERRKEGMPPGMFGSLKFSITARLQSSGNDEKHRICGGGISRRRCLSWNCEWE